MTAKWAEDFQPKPLLDRIAGICRLDGTRVSFEGFALQEWRAVIEEHLILHDDIPAPACHGIVWTALVECGRRGNFSSKAFLEAASRLERQYLAQPLQQYYLLSSVSLQHSDDLELPSFRGCRFFLTRRTGMRFDRTPIEANLRYLFDARPLPSQYTAIRVAVRGRTPEEAGVKSINALDLVRAILNFQINLTKGMRSFSGRPQPINLVAPGPVSTLHERSGKLAKEMWWYEPDYVEPARLIGADDLCRWRRNEPWILKRIRSHPYRDEMEKVLTRYSRALDETNYDFAIIKLWSVLERLMGIDKYKVVVRRAAFLYADPEHHRAILNHIRRYRNRMIHGGHSANTRNETVHQLREYVQQAILFHLRPALGARRIAERVQLLDMPYQLTELRKRRRLLDHAIRFRTPRRKRANVEKKPTAKIQVDGR